MTKNKKNVGILLLLTLALYNLVFFVLPITKNITFFISYGFGLFAIIVQLLIIYTAWGKSKTTKSKFMGVPLLIVGFRYLFAQLISSLIFLICSLFFESIPFFIPLIIDAILLAIFIYSFVMVEISKDQVEAVDEIVDKKVFYIKSLKTDVDIILQMEEKENIKELLLCLAEKIKYSDPMSNTSVEIIEAKLIVKIDELKIAVKEKDEVATTKFIQEATLLLNERNLKIKI